MTDALGPRPISSAILRKAREMGSSLDLPTTLNQAARLAVPEIADWCVIDLLDSDGAVVRMVAAHADPAKEAEMARTIGAQTPSYGRGPAAAAVRGEAMLIPVVTPEHIEQNVDDQGYRALLLGLNIRSILSVPLLARGHVTGVLTLVTAESARVLTGEDMEIAEELGAWAGLAIGNVQMYEEQIANRRETDRLIAERDAMLMQMADGVMVAEPSGVITFMNDAARELYGQDFVGWRIHEFPSNLTVEDTRGAPLTAQDNPLVAALDDGRVTTAAEAVFRRPDGSEATLQRSCRPVRSSEGELLAAVMTIRDVTAERAAERTRETFLAAAAHDLRTPLTVMQGMAQLLVRQLRDGGVTESQLSMLQRIEMQARHMTALVSEMLEVSRHDSDPAGQLNRELIDLSLLVETAVRDHEAASQNHSFHLSLPGPGTAVGSWDRERIARVVGNILSNAVRFSPDGGSIEAAVSVDAEKQEAYLMISDQGIGIPAADLPHVFDRFFRAGNVNELTRGTGIGLTATKQLVEMHGGSISIESQVGQGTRVEIRLPLYPHAVTEARSGAA